MNSLQEVWEQALNSLSKTMTATAINAWFSDCSPVEIDGSCLVIRTTGDFKKQIIENRFKEQLKAALSDIFSEPFDVMVLTDEDYANYEEKKPEPNELPEMSDLTFERFIVGKCNEFAHASAMAVAANPGKTYNPLFIYGNSGLGKTHLLFAIGHAIQQSNPKAVIIYIKGDEFTNELILAIKEGKTQEFHNKYRNADLFLVDDIQFIAGKQQTQNEFFHSFNSIFEARHQIVITSDRPPIEMNLLDDRLRTRFEGGLMADIQPPDFETREAIARNKAAKFGLILTDEAYEFIAESIKTNIRQLEGVINKLSAYKNIMNETITIEAVKRAIDDVARHGSYVPTPDRIITQTARYYLLSPEDIRGQNRSKNTALARQISMYLMRNLTNLSLNDIGTEFEGRNHTTVLASIRKIEELITTDPSMAATIRDITSNINTV